MENLDNLWFGLNQGEIIAASSAVIALCAMAVTVWQGWISREHNKLSVQPHLDISLDFVEGQTVNINISNYGIGPALLKGLKCKVNEGAWEINKPTDYNPVFNALNMPLSTMRHSLVCFDSSSVIGVNKTENLMSFPGSETNNDLNKKLIKGLSALEITIDYSCIYGKSFKSSSQHLP